MAGHSQFKNIMYRKGAQDAKKARVFAKLAREITVAAKSGIPEPDKNPRLRLAIQAARAESMPKDNIERAIAKANQTAGGADFVSMRYEGFAPNKAAVIVEALTDNVNRAFVEVRTAVTKRGGHLGTPGSVSFNFTECGLLEFKGTNRDEVEENLIMGDVDVMEVELDEDIIVVKTAPTALNDAKVVLEGMGVTEFETCEITMIPNDYVTLTGEDAEKFKNMLDVLDEVGDVQAVYHNAKFE